MLQNRGPAILKSSNEALFICTAASKIPVAAYAEPSAQCACLFAQVQKHLSKLFDNMAKMRFEEDGEGNPLKTAQGMYSKEEEYVPFNQSCDCTGQVQMHP